MYVTAIRTQGLRGADGYEQHGLDRVVELGPGPNGIAVADALTIAAATFDATRLRRAAVTLGLADKPDDVQVLEEDNTPVQATFPRPAGVASLLPIGGGRHITVTIELSLDPPLFGRLRGHAVRDPRLVTALGEGAMVTIKTGWLFTNDLATVATSLVGIAVGDTAFPVTGTDRPTWLPELLREVGGRFGRVAWSESAETIGGRMLDAALSPDPDRRSRYRSAARALAGAPFHLGALELVRFGDRVEPCFGPGLLRARQFGPAATEALRVADAVFLQAPDVLVVEASGGAQTDPVAFRAWLADHVRGDDATLEQVILVPGGAQAGEKIA